MQPPIDFPGTDGFLGTRASLMLDVVVVAMFLVIAVMMLSIYVVRKRKEYVLHKRIQLTLGTLLLITVVAFEIDMRLFGWQERAAGELGGTPEPLVWNMLYVHLCFAISSAILWPVVIVRALRQFSSPPAPNQHSKSHHLWARLAAIDMLMTAITGWIFYYTAFVR